jgi:hypothetical protein
VPRDETRREIRPPSSLGNLVQADRRLAVPCQNHIRLKVIDFFANVTTQRKLGGY